MNEVLFWLLMTVAPLPAIWLWLRWRERRDARIVADIMEERRRKFGGAIREPGSTKARRIDR